MTKYLKFALFNNIFKKVIPNFSCCCCKQYSKTIMCEHCEADVEDLFKYSKVINLLNWPLVSNHISAPQYNILCAPGWYTWPYNTMVHKLKYQRQSFAASWLTDAFEKHVLQHKPEIPECLIPVPISYQRLSSRHFNQADLLAGMLAEKIHRPVERLVHRIHHTKKQQTLNKRHRQGNLSNVFSSEPSLNRYHHVAIVDDVLTTGSTLNAMCKSIRMQNPKIKVSAWVMAVTASKRI